MSVSCICPYDAATVSSSILGPPSEESLGNLLIVPREGSTCWTVQVALSSVVMDMPEYFFAMSVTVAGCALAVILGGVPSKSIANFP
jgi:hypothetical protein